MIAFLLYKIFIFLSILFLLPLLILISLLLYFFSGLPILFKQIRTGKDGKPFMMYKFRTMKNGSEKRQKLLRGKNEVDGPVFKIHNDPRFTSIGRVLGHTGLDELPQLWNVFIGDMTIVGPRALPVSEARHLTPWQRKRFSIKPGIISPWILNGYHSKPFSVWMKSDIAYIEKKSFWYDAMICMKIIPYMGRLVLKEVKSMVT